MFPGGEATEGAKKRKVTHVSGRRSDRGAKKEKGHACFPEGKATEEQKKRKVTHISGRQSDRGAKKEKGHAYFWKAKRQTSKKRKRSRMFLEDIATEGPKKRKVTHFSGSHSDGGAKKEKGHAYFRKAKRRRCEKRERSRIFLEGKATEE